MAARSASDELLSHHTKRFSFVVPNLESDEPKAPYASPFRDMAERVDLNINAGNNFGGAFVVVLPNGEVHHALILDSAENPAMFLGALSARVTIMAAELENAERQNSGGGFGRK